MRSRRSLLVSSALALSLLVGIGIRYRVRHATTPAAGASLHAGAAPSRAPIWRRGVATTFDFDWRGEESVRAEVVRLAGSSSIEGAVALRGKLVLSALGEKDGAMVLSARIDPSAEHRLVLLGADALASDEATRKTFASSEAFVSVEPNGRIRAIHLRRDAPPLFAHLARGLLEQLETVFPGDGSGEWTTTERGPRGEARVHYAPADDDAHAYARTREEYTHIASVPDELAAGATTQVIDRGRVVLADDGALATLTDDESIAMSARDSTSIMAAKNTLALTRVSTATFDPPAVIAIDDVALAAYRPGEASSTSAESTEARMERVADGLTTEELESRIAMIGAGGSMPTGFLSRAAALVALHPELGDVLAHDFEQPTTGLRGREAILDVLAAAGTGRAQGSMRDALSSDAALADRKHYAQLLQRFSFVAKPDSESVAFLRRTFDAAHARGDGDRAMASAYSLGAVASHLARNGDAAGARAVTAPLAARLASSRDAHEKAGLLRALGNAGTSDVKGIASGYARDDDPQLRAAAADALRKLDDPDARTMLTTMLSDASPDVAHVALQALAQGSADASDIERVATAAASGSTAALSDKELVTFFGSHRAPAGAVEAALSAIVARANGASIPDNETAMRAQALIDEIQGKSRVPVR